MGAGLSDRVHANWTDRAAQIRVRIGSPQYDESKFARKRFLEPEEVAALLRQLPEHLRCITTVAVATGLRMSNVTGMRWKWVNLQARTVTIPGK